MSLIQNFISRFVPVVKADNEDEIVDPQKVLRETCSQEKKCMSLQEKLNTCTDRVNSRSNTSETCMEEMVDFVQCVDHCVAKTLFSKLK